VEHATQAHSEHKAARLFQRVYRGGVERLRSLLTHWRVGEVVWLAEGAEEGHVQHRAEVAPLGHGLGDIKAVGGRLIAHARKAQPPDQRGMLEQKRAQVTHVAFALVQLDQVSGDEARARVGARARGGRAGARGSWPRADRR
jgi:hypothetical protein